MKNIHCSSSALVANYLTTLRDIETSTKEFRDAAAGISHQLISEATADLPLTKKNIDTPMTAFAAPIMNNRLILITILRAGLAMTSSAMSLFPDAAVGFAGLRRDEKTAIAEEYYWQVPKILDSDTVLLLDPMLATGGSLLHVLRRLETTKHVRLITIISAPEGITAIHNEFPHLPIYTAAVDEKLNDKKYIVPGLGDFGDRYFGTE